MSCKVKQKGARKAGWLSKRGGRIHTWHKRWFVLTGDMMFYYKTPQDTRPTGTIPLAGNRVLRHPDDGKQSSTYKFEIIAGSDRQVITSTHNTYLISADNGETADNWVAAIRRVMHEPYGGGMFGRSLDETMQVEARLGGAYVPVLLHRCVKFIKEHGIRELGIFRLPGQASRIQALKETYDQGCQADFGPTEDVHTVASLLKLYLRELPEPVVPYVLYQSFTDALKLYEGRQGEGVDELNRLLLQVPRVNFNVLKYMIRFLDEVQEHADDNKMNSMNLGTIFGPHLLRPKTDNPQVLMECNNISADFVRLLIARHEEFFPVTSDERPAKRLSVVYHADTSLPPWPDNKLTAHSFYNAKPNIRGTGAYRSRQNSAPPDSKGKLGGKVASMVEQFNNLRSSKHSSVGSQLQNSLRNVEITAPIQNPDSSFANPPTVTGPFISLPLLQNGGPSTLTSSLPPSTAGGGGGAGSSNGSSVNGHRPVSSGAEVVVRTGSLRTGSMRSGRVFCEDDLSDMWKNSPVYRPPPEEEEGELGPEEGEEEEVEDDSEVPEMLRKMSQSGFPPLFTRNQSDTISSEIIVNSISNELETLEQQLVFAREELAKYKKAAHLWKSRYDQEKRARVAAEEQIRDLQVIIDETFQQFALDDSEDDFEEDSANGSVPSLANSDEPTAPPLFPHLSPQLGRKRGVV